MTTAVERPAKRYRVVGTRPIRHDGLEKVTGRARYGADVLPAGVLYGAVLRSPHAHARVLRIDTSAAEAAPGVRAVVTRDDFPEAQKGVFMEVLANTEVVSENMMARDKVLYKGHALAAVAAESKHLAEEGLKLIRVDYEELSPVLDVREAMKPGASLVHEDQRMITKVEEDGSQDAPSNVAFHLQFKRGDVEQGLAEAEAVVEREFHTRPVHPGYIEPQNCTAWWGPDGKLTIWTSNQGPFVVRHQVACLLNIPASDVKVVPMEIGGGFGGKVLVYLDAAAAVLSRKTGHPVKMVMSRQEVFQGTGPAPGSYMRLKMGAARDGRITAVEFFLALEAGAFPGAPVAGAMNSSLAPYNLENMLVDGYDVVVNKPKAGAYRAPGAPIGALAVEAVIDELAQELGLDPMVLRRRNATKQGDRQPNGAPFPSIGGVEVEEALMAHPHYRAPLPGPDRGRGVAMGYWGNGGFSSTATIGVNSDGTINLVTGSVDIGGTRVAVAMQAAEALGLAAEDVRPTVVDTDSIAWTGVTGGSRTAFSTGIAAVQAAAEVRRQLIERAARIWETDPSEVDFEDGALVSRANPSDRMTFKELAGKLLETGGPVSATGRSEPKGVGPVFAGLIVDVRVDRETGKVDVERATTFIDAGTAVHPSYVEGQMQGGTVQGIGWALNEEYCFDAEGTLLNPSFLDYRMPTSLDLPMVDTEIIEVPNPGHPFGLRGVGEVSLVPVMGAMANAISRAIGVRVRDLPMNPGSVLEALEGGAPG